MGIFLNPGVWNRGGGAYNDRGYSEGSLHPREGVSVYSGGPFAGDPGYERETSFPHGWPASRRRSLEEEIALQRGAHRLEKPNQGREAYKDYPYQRTRRDYSLERAGRDLPVEREPARDINLERASSRTGSRDREIIDGDPDWEYRRDRHSQESREGGQDVEIADLSRLRSGTPSRLRRDDIRGQEIPRLGEDNIPSSERSGRRSRGEDRESSRRRRDRDYGRSRSRSRERGRWTPDRGRGHDRPRSYGHDDREYSRRSRSPRSRSRSGRESSYEDSRLERRRDRETTRYHAATSQVQDLILFEPTADLLFITSWMLNWF